MKLHRSTTQRAVVAAMGLSLLAAVRTQAWSFFTNESDFTNAITAESFTETFNGLPGGSYVPSPTSFTNTNAAVIFDAISTAGSGAENLFCLDPKNWLQVSDPAQSLVFTNFRPGTTAIGGSFFATDNDGYGEFAEVPVTLSVQLSDATTVSTNVTPLSPTNFSGFSFGSAIRSLTISAPPGYYSTARLVIVGFNATNTDTIVTIGNGKLFYSFVASSSNAPIVVATTNLVLSNSWSTNNVTALTPIELSPELTRYRFETPVADTSQRFLRVMP